MWGGGQGNHSSPPEGFNRSPTGSNADSPSNATATQAAAAAALAARMAFANAYDIGASVPVPPAASSSYYDIYGGQPEQDESAILYAQQRARELEFLHLQQQIQERQVIENEARTRLLEHAARNQIQEFERTRMEISLLAEIQQLDQEARFEVERSRLVQSEAMQANNAHALRSQLDIDADAAQILQEQQLAEYIARQKEQSVEYESNNPQQRISSNINESSHVMESKTELSPSLKSNKYPVKNAVESFEKKEFSPQKKKSSPKKEQYPKKDAPSIEDDPLPVNAKSPPRKSVAPKEEAKVPVSTPSSSHQGAEKKMTPVQAKSSSAVSKKRKSTPSKTSGAASAATTVSKAKQAKKSPGSSAGGGKGTPSPSNLSLLLKRKPGTPSLDDTLPGITDVQYENVEALMDVFCKVPLLAEFSRPVILLHPEVSIIAGVCLHNIVIDDHIYSRNLSSIMIIR